VVLLVVLLPLVLAFLLLWLSAAVTLLVLVWLMWLPRRRYALVVYSNSPVWQEYFETRILPQVGERAGILNWSERRRWGPTLSVFLFRVFAGSREYNPIAIVFAPLSWPRQFRFYDAFRAFKHGKPAEVERLRQELLALLDQLAPPPAGISPRATS
jgi:hypothetical protein